MEVERWEVIFSLQIRVHPGLNPILIAAVWSKVALQNTNKRVTPPVTMKPPVALTTILLLGCLIPAANSQSVLSWGQFVVPVVEPDTRFRAVAAGDDYNLAVKTDG